jgi:hypothetical protein
MIDIKILVIATLVVLVAVLLYLLYNKKESYCMCRNAYLQQLGLVGKECGSCVNYQPTNDY